MAVTERTEAILKTIVTEHIATAAPVASGTIARDYNLKVSPATIRNDVAYLEEEGYITRPHTSAGAVPTDKAYRYYVESLSSEGERSPIDAYLVSELLKEAKLEIEQWLRTAAMLLAHIVRNIAVVTLPKATQCRLKHLDLVAIQDFLAMLILVLCETKVRQKTLSFDNRVTQDELTGLAAKLNADYAQLTRTEICAEKIELSADEKRVTDSIISIMASEDSLQLGRPHLEGLHLLLGQPEFTGRPSPLNLLELLQQENWLERSVQHQHDTGRVKVIIGEENEDATLQDLSLVIGEYGVQEQASGIVGVIGPKRMDYARAISSVDCLSSLLTESIADYM